MTLQMLLTCTCVVSDGQHHANGVRGFLRKVSCFIKTIKACHQIASEVKVIKSRLINISEDIRDIVTYIVDKSKAQGPQQHGTTLVVMPFYLKKLSL